MALKKGVVEEFFGGGFCGNSGHYQGSLHFCRQAGFPIIILLSFLTKSLLYICQPTY
jgi:hypothetical protein